MNPFSVDAKDMLEAESALDLTFGTNLFIGTEPVEPDNVVTLYDTYGWAPDPKFDYENPTLQVRVRDRDYATGWGVAHDIKMSLHNRYEETWTSTRYLAIFGTSDVFFIGRDEHDRFLFTVNFRAQRV